MLTWDELVRLEPSLDTVAMNATAFGRIACLHRHPVSETVYLRFRQQLSKLVGSERYRIDKLLSEPEAYEVALREITRRLGY